MLLLVAGAMPAWPAETLPELRDCLLAWDEPAEEPWGELRGFRIYARPDAGAYDFNDPKVEIPAVLTLTLQVECATLAMTLYVPGIYHAVITAMDRRGNESKPSNEISFWVGSQGQEPSKPGGSQGHPKGDVPQVELPEPIVIISPGTGQAHIPAEGVDPGGWASESCWYRGTC